MYTQHLVFVGPSAPRPTAQIQVSHQDMLAGLQKFRLGVRGCSAGLLALFTKRTLRSIIRATSIKDHVGEHGFLRITSVYGTRTVALRLRHLKRSVTQQVTIL